MSAHGLLGDIVIALGAAVCVGLSMAVVIIWICSWRWEADIRSAYGFGVARCMGNGNSCNGL